MKTDKYFDMVGVCANCGAEERQFEKLQSCPVCEKRFCFRCRYWGLGAGVYDRGVICVSCTNKTRVKHETT